MIAAVLVQQLDRDLLFETAIVPACEPYLAGAATAEGAYQAPGADLATGVAHPRGLRCVEEARRCLDGLQQGVDVAAQRRVLACRLEKCGTAIGRPVERCVEQGVDAREAVGRARAHAALPTPIVGAGATPPSSR